MSKNRCLFSSILAEAHAPVVAKTRHFASLAITSLQINFGVTHTGDSTELGKTEGSEVDDLLERDMGDAMLCGVSCTDTVHGGGDAEEEDKLLQL